ncbi:hypothetical protein VTJ83DRAFT_3710 [Remersonia thermophila]|uniref:Uncharacterized protein n=1 Tax=Remersonia thermophila TaxID=72144 RepID=A0ABR4DFP6_9PEZI
MLSAGKLQHRCPGCRAQLLSFYDALLLPRARPAAQPFLQRRRAQPPLTSTAAAAAAAAAPRSWPVAGTARHFSSTPSRRQDPAKLPTDPAGPQSPEEIETLVRQARQTFGNTLPPGYLSPEEYKVYERLYGPPLRETRPEDVGIPFHRGGAAAGGSGQPTLLRQTEQGHLEEVEYTFDPSTAMEEQVAAQERHDAEEPYAEELGAEEEYAEEEEGGVEGLEADALDAADALELAGRFPLAQGGSLDYLQVTANNPRELEALLKLQADFEAAALRPAQEGVREEETITEEEEVEEEEEEMDEDDGEPDARFVEPREVAGSRRLHEYTRLGRFGTKPSTLQLPKATLVEPISELLARTEIAHVRETAERVLGGPGLPYGPATPKSKSNLPQKPLLLQAGHHRMSKIEADAYLAAVMPGLYATVTSVLVEVRKRLGEAWLRELLTRPGGAGPRVLDVGAGGAGLAAWQDVLKAGWDVLREKGEVAGREPPSKRTVVVGNENLRQRVSRFLHNTTFLPRLPDYIHSLEGAERKLDAGGEPQQRKVFDVIIASHVLMPLDKEYKRRELLDNLWSMLSPEGGVLIVVEKGHPRGFEAVAEVRDRLLSEFIVPPSPSSAPREAAIQPEGERVREPGMIIAPCTNHAKCPMYLTPGLSKGRKDFCHFSQRFIRPPFLQRILGASHRSHEDIDFSYLAVRRGAQPAPSPAYLMGKEATDRAFAGYEQDPPGQAPPPPPPHPLSLPRNILTPLKRRGHVTLDVCTPAGDIERWVVPRSFSKQAYHDARKAAWGDLWALGAKTRTPRKIRLGRPGQQEDGNKKKRTQVVEVNVHPQFGVLSARDRQTGQDVSRLSDKRGKRVKMEDLWREMGGDEVEDPEDLEDAEYLKGAQEEEDTSQGKQT